jgi:lipoprotein-anchoring transpeptidase ErfK/SrfK
MRSVVRYLFVMVAITSMSLLGSGARGVAAVPLPQPIPGVATVLPADGAVVGVAHPVVVTFTAPITDRTAAERSIHVRSPSNMSGHFEWVDNNVVQWVPNHYWPAHTHV